MPCKKHNHIDNWKLRPCKREHRVEAALYIILHIRLRLFTNGMHICSIDMIYRTTYKHFSGHSLEHLGKKVYKQFLCIEQIVK